MCKVGIGRGTCAHENMLIPRATEEISQQPVSECYSSLYGCRFKRLTLTTNEDSLIKGVPAVSSIYKIGGSCDSVGYRCFLLFRAASSTPGSRYDSAATVRTEPCAAHVLAITSTLLSRIDRKTELQLIMREKRTFRGKIYLIVWVLCMFSKKYTR